MRKKLAQAKVYHFGYREFLWKVPYNFHFFVHGYNYSWNKLWQL